MFESLSDRFNSVFRSLSGRGRISEDNVRDAMREVRTALLEADVHLDVVKSSDVVRGLLNDPKVRMHIDDGRRWLRSHPNEAFDAIVMNTTFHWRAHATNVLSAEYLELSRRRLRPGGIIYLNTTSSTAAQRTVATVFPHALRFQNMIIAGDRPIRIDRDRWRRQLQRWTIDGRPVIDARYRDKDFATILNQRRWRGIPTWENRLAILRRTSSAPVITDDNMATEWWAQGTYP